MRLFFLAHRPLSFTLRWQKGQRQLALAVLWVGKIAKPSSEQNHIPPMSRWLRPLWPRLNDHREGNLGDTDTENVSLNALPRPRLLPLTVGVARRRGIVRPPATTPNL